MQVIKWVVVMKGCILIILRRIMIFMRRTLNSESGLIPSDDIRPNGTAYTLIMVVLIFFYVICSML
jgi:hypothetical protein